MPITTKQHTSMNTSAAQSQIGKIQFLPARPMLVSRPSQFHTERKTRKPSFITDLPGQKPYTLLFEEDVLPSGVSGLQSVRVSSLEEVQQYLVLLGDTCELYLSRNFSREHADLSAKLHLLGVRRIKPDSCSDPESTRRFLNRLPLDLRSLLQSPLALTDDDRLPQPINPSFIHKKNVRNALLSEPFIDGKFLYFNMFDGIDEFRFDHESDHLQGMLILEAMRQAAIAAGHILGGLPLDGGMTLLTYDTGFYNYVENTSPVILRTYSNFNCTGDDDEVESYAVCHLYQWGKLCAEASLKAFIFKNRERYATHRIRSGKIMDRVKRQYDAKLSLLETQGVRS
ncbi:MAG: hypothetical protein FJZ79_01330 [Chlorobi bacterium]|nr:hypothetical protein [Chlorobiota bacterium]